MNDLRYPTAEEEAQKHKLKRLVQAPNSYFMDVKCPGCFNMFAVAGMVLCVVPPYSAMPRLLLCARSSSSSLHSPLVATLCCALLPEARLALSLAAPSDPRSKCEMVFQ